MSDNKALTVYQPKDLADVKYTAQLFAESGMFNDSRQMAQAFVKIMAGGAMGFDPFASMTGIHIISGKPTLGAGLIAAAVQRHPDFDYDVIEHSAQKCAITFMKVRAGKWIKAGTSEFTMADAKEAGLLSNATWNKYPRNMLYARAMSNGARWYCAGVFGGSVYTPEELGAEIDGDGDIVQGVVVEDLAVPHQGMHPTEQMAQSAMTDYDMAGQPSTDDADDIGDMPAEIEEPNAKFADATEMMIVIGGKGFTGPEVVAKLAEHEETMGSAVETRTVKWFVEQFPPKQ